jgi:hypothetical protein
MRRPALRCQRLRPYLHSVAPLLIGQDEKRYRLRSSHATQAVLQVAREVDAVAFPQLDCMRSKDDLYGP